MFKGLTHKLISVIRLLVKCFLYLLSSLTLNEELWELWVRGTWPQTPEQETSEKETLADGIFPNVFGVFPASVGYIEVVGCSLWSLLLPCLFPSFWNLLYCWFLFLLLKRSWPQGKEHKQKSRAPQRLAGSSSSRDRRSQAQSIPLLQPCFVMMVKLINFSEPWSPPLYNGGPSSKLLHGQNKKTPVQCTKMFSVVISELYEFAVFDF